MESFVLLILLLRDASGSTSIIPCIECDSALMRPPPSPLLRFDAETGAGGNRSGTLCDCSRGLYSSSSSSETPSTCSGELNPGLTPPGTCSASGASIGSLFERGRFALAGGDRGATPLDLLPDNGDGTPAAASASCSRLASASFFSRSSSVSRFVSRVSCVSSYCACF